MIFSYIFSKINTLIWGLQLYNLLANLINMVDKRSSPAYSISHSTSSFKPHSQFVPGPGAYQHPTSIHPTTQGSIRKHGGTQQRFKQYTTLAPGPGAYNSAFNKQHIPTALVLSRTKESTKIRQQVPGPGSYNPNFHKIIKQESGFKIGNSQKIADSAKNAGKTPGPGNYQTNISTVKKEHAIVIGSQKRSDMVLNHFTPGPGQYKAPTWNEVTLSHSPMPVFGKSARSLSTSNLVPGPGSYKVPDKITEAMLKSKGFSMSSKFHENNKFIGKVPGPGAYNAEELDKLRHKAASFSIGKAEKLRLQNQKQLLALPGPQKYTVKIDHFQTKNVIIGKQKRPSLAQQTVVPGPGAYTAKAQSSLPNFSIPKSNSSWLKHSQTPGPGTYQPKPIEDTEYNSIRITKDQRRPFYDEKKGIPGPGTYYPDNNKSGGFKMGNEKRAQITGHKHPGPGEYTIPSTISNIPRYSK